MKLVSTTLTGSNEDIIAGAIESAASEVDVCLVIDTGVTDMSINVAREIAGDKLVVAVFNWCSDFSAARNFALERAAELGDWAITVDTDERIEWHGENIRKKLKSRSDVGCWMMKDTSGTYEKERIFRLPAKERFSGATHEAFPAFAVGRETLPNARFMELSKTPDQLQHKFKRDEAILRDWIKTHANEPRWFYYLGDCLQNQKRFEEAIEAYGRCSGMRGWSEERAWACYRQAECWCALELWDCAVESCARGLARHAGIGELAWLAGWANYKKGDYEQAIFWSHMAIELNGLPKTRIGFRNPMAMHEGPWDVIRWSLKALGRNELETTAAERNFLLAQQARLGQ